MTGNGSKDKGWIKAPRYWLDDPIIMKNSNYFAVWIYLNMLATHQERDVEFDGKRYHLQPGELITGRKSIKDNLKIAESTIQRILLKFSSDGLIQQKTTNKNRLITIKLWKKDQQSEHQNEQPDNAQIPVVDILSTNFQNTYKLQGAKKYKKNRTTVGQRPNTNKNYKNLKNEKNRKLPKSEVRQKFKEYESNKINQVNNHSYSIEIEKMSVDNQIKLLYQIWNREVYFKEYDKASNLINKFNVRDVWYGFEQALESSSPENNCCNLNCVERILNSNSNNTN